ncbi:MAG TPA: hypothetical protein DCO83_01605, partial [Mucilaginibacter sp.]|nr:hypothetical protein [Mucilaginibacter sp.]
MKWRLNFENIIIIVKNVITIFSRVPLSVLIMKNFQVNLIGLSHPPLFLQTRPGIRKHFGTAVWLITSAEDTEIHGSTLNLLVFFQKFTK